MHGSNRGASRARRCRLMLASFAIALTAALFSFAAVAADKDNPMVVMQTNLGSITIEVYEEAAPKTAENFLTYVRDGFYDGTIFHRVIPGFVIQGGGFDSDYQRQSTRDPIVNESDNGLKNRRATLSMARTSNPDSATSQFFINLTDNPPLDGAGGRPGYAVFGEVTEGMDVVDAIADIETGAAGPFHQDVPQRQVVIESASITEP